jgi:hypothetical protein
MEAVAATCDGIGTTWYEYENVIHAKTKKSEYTKKFYAEWRPGILDLCRLG